MKKRILFSIIAMMLFTITAFAQVKITGTVVGKADGEPLIGATVKEVGAPASAGSHKATATERTQAAAITDMDGNFSINVKKGAKLQFSYVGYESQTIAASDGMQVQLSDAAELQELVVTGYQVQRKADLTGAVGVMDMKLPKSEGSNNIVNSLQGRIPGVSVTTDPAPGGGSSSIQIRGMSSFYGNNQPLYVIDGVATTENLNSINPADIESIQVLKDASSASIYGSRAANGVVIVTTKSGKGDKLKVNVGYSASAQFIAKKLDMMNANQWGTAYYQAATNAGVTPYNDWFTYDSEGNAYLNQYVAGHEGQPGYELHDTDWQDAIYQTAWTHNLNASISNSSEKGSMMFSANYITQNGIMKESMYKRYTARINSTYNVSKYVTVGENLSIARWNSNIGSTGDDSSVAYRAMAQFPGMPVYQSDGSFSNASQIMKSDRNNPMAELSNAADNDNVSWRIFGNAYIQAKILNCITLKSNFGYDRSQYTTDNLNRKINSTDDNSVSRSYGSGDNWTWTNTANYNGTFGKHTINTLLGVESIGYKGESFGATRLGYKLETTNYMVLNAGTGEQTVSGTKNEWGLLSYFGKVDYNYADRYLFSMTLRHDKTSRLGSSNNSGTFPAFSAAWRITEEKFWKKNDILNDLKLRIAWGQNGNSAIGDYATYTTYAADAGTSYDITGTGTSFTPGLAVSSTGAEDLKWETTTQFNLGLDSRFFGSKLGFTADFFVKTTNDMLTMPPTLAAEGQNASRWRNTGKMRNTGIELTVDYRSPQYNDFSWTGSFNFAHYTNKVLALNDNQTSIGGDYRLMVDQPMGVYYGYVCDGIYQTAEEVANHATQEGAAPGKMIYRDLNGDGQITDADRCIIGKSTSDFSMGLNLDLKWKQFTMSMFFTGDFGFDIRNVTKSQLTTFYYGVTATNRGTEALNAWTTNNTVTDIPQLSLSDNTKDQDHFSTYNLEDGSYFKMKYIKFGYDVPASFCKKLYMSSLNVYAQLENVFTITNYSGLDPELAHGTYGVLVDNSPYPRARTFSMGLNVSF